LKKISIKSLFLLFSSLSLSP